MSTKCTLILFRCPTFESGTLKNLHDNDYTLIEKNILNQRDLRTNCRRAYKAPISVNLAKIFFCRSECFARDRSPNVASKARSYKKKNLAFLLKLTLIRRAYKASNQRYECFIAFPPTVCVRKSC